MGCSPTSFFVHELSPASILEWIAITFSRGITHSRNQTCASYLSVQFSHKVVSNSLWPHELQHARLPCPSPTPGPYSNSCPLSQWYHPTISSSIIPFSSCLQYLLAKGSFQMSQFFYIRWPKNWSFCFSISPANEYLRLISFRMDWLNLLAVQGILKRSSPTPQFKSINFSMLSFLHSPILTSIHNHWEKP